MIINQEKLKVLLKKQNITKSALCEKLGISSRTIAKISKGEDIAERIIVKIAEYLGYELSDLINGNEILQTLRNEKMHGLKGRLYHETQIRLTYNSNHIEGSKLTEDQTRYIFETKTLGDLPSNVPIDDVIETNNHFRCIDFIIDKYYLCICSCTFNRISGRNIVHNFRCSKGNNSATCDRYCFSSFWLLRYAVIMGKVCR